MNEYTPKKVSIWLSAESQRVIGDRNRSGTINAMIERVGAVVEMDITETEEDYLEVKEICIDAYNKLPKKINGCANPDAKQIINQFCSSCCVSRADAIILLEQIESGKL